MEYLDKNSNYAINNFVDIHRTIILAGDTNVNVNSHQDPKSGTNKFLKTSTFFNTSIYQQEMGLRSLTMLL